jgi:RimJ/RimL family protein N-acetyltransferase
MKLKSQRIDIMPLTPNELKVFVKSRSDFEMHSKLNVSKVELTDAYREEILEMIEKDPTIWQRKGTDYLFYTLWIIVDRESKNIIGMFTFNGKSNSNGEVEVFFSIEPPYRRMGFATEAMETILCWGNKTELFRIVIVEAFENNKAAMASLKKLGFKKVLLDEDEDEQIEKSTKYYKVVCPKNIDCEELDFDI